jgi:hypothetical protein
MLILMSSKILLYLFNYDKKKEEREQEESATLVSFLPTK